LSDLTDSFKLESNEILKFLREISSNSDEYSNKMLDSPSSLESMKKLRKNAEIEFKI